MRDPSGGVTRYEQQGNLQRCTSRSSRRACGRFLHLAALYPDIAARGRRRSRRAVRKLPGLLPLLHVHPHPTGRDANPPPNSPQAAFPAPGLPKGHVLMGYDDHGQCPMLKGGECSIYDDRPQTCRDYDCRVFAATGIAVDREAQPEIARRVAAWAFTYENAESRAKSIGRCRRRRPSCKPTATCFPKAACPTTPCNWPPSRCGFTGSSRS